MSGYRCAKIQSRPRISGSIAAILVLARDVIDALADYFLNCLFEDFDRLERFAGIHERRRNYFRLISERFPYLICYRQLIISCTTAFDHLATRSTSDVPP